MDRNDLPLGGVQWRPHVNNRESMDSINAREFMTS
jgi:hypothetical protein